MSRTSFTQKLAATCLLNNWQRTFAHSSSDKQRALAKQLSDQDMSKLLSNLRHDDRTRFLESLPAETRENFFRLLNYENSNTSRQLLSFPVESVGRYMTPDFISVQADWTIGRALEHIRLKGREIEMLGTIYVTTEDGTLVDALELEKFVLGNPSDQIHRIMDHSFVALSPEEDREEAVRKNPKIRCVCHPRHR